MVVGGRDGGREGGRGRGKSVRKSGNGQLLEIVHHAGGIGLRSLDLSELRELSSETRAPWQLVNPSLSLAVVLRLECVEFKESLKEFQRPLRVVRGGPR